MSLDNKTLEIRLLTKDSVIGASTSLTKCAAKLHHLGNNLNDREALEAFMREVLLMRLEAHAAKTAFDVFDRQNTEYDELEANIKDKTQAKIEYIAHLEEELRQQQLIREHRMACEFVAAKVNKYPSRSTLKRKIDAISCQMEETEKTVKSVEVDIVARKAQFDALLESIAELQKPLPAEGEEEGAIREMNIDANAEEEEDDDDDEENIRRDADREPRAGGNDGEGAEKEGGECDVIAEILDQENDDLEEDPEEEEDDEEEAVETED